MSKSKTPKRDDYPAAQQLLDADIALRAVADAFASNEEADETDQLRKAAIAFAEAWNACGSAA
jgi:hypothetical protein